MNRPRYRIEIFWSDEDDGYVANIPDLRYCSAFGETYEEALSKVLVAMDLHLETLEEFGRPIPEPKVKELSPVSDPSEKFANAIRESYQALADQSVPTRELNAQITQDFFKQVINNLRTQAENNEALAQDKIEQHRKHEEASRAISQESVNAYTAFLNSMFAYYQNDLRRTGRITRK